MGERTRAIENAQIGRDALGDLLPGIAVDREVPVESPIEPVEKIDDHSDNAEKEHQRVHTAPPSTLLRDRFHVTFESAAQ
jgi:hypothetical protein